MKYRFFYLLVVNDILSNFTLFCPYILISQAYDGALAAIIAAFLISVIRLYFYLYTFNYFKKKALVEINRILFGKFLGNILSYTYIFLGLAISFFMYKGLVEIVKNFMLITSPLLLISVIIVIVPAITLRNTNSTFLQSMAFTTVLMIIGIAAEVALSTGKINPDFLKGSVMHSISLPKFSGITAAAAFFSGAYHLSLFNPEFKKISYKKILLLVAIVGFFTAFVAVYIPMGIWGPEAAKKLMFPWVTTTDTISIDLFIIERALFLMMPLFFLLALSNALIYSFVSYGLFIKLHPSKKLEKYIKLGICTIFVVGSIMMPNTKTVFESAPDVMIVWYVFQLLLSALLFFRTKGKEKLANE